MVRLTWWTSAQKVKILLWMSSLEDKFRSPTFQIKTLISCYASNGKWMPDLNFQNERFTSWFGVLAEIWLAGLGQWNSKPKVKDQIRWKWSSTNDMPVLWILPLHGKLPHVCMIISKFTDTFLNHHEKCGQVLSNNSKKPESVALYKTWQI